MPSILLGMGVERMNRQSSFPEQTHNLTVEETDLQGYDAVF